MRVGKRLSAALCLGLAAAAAAPGVAGAQARSDVWDAVSGHLPATKGGSAADIRASSYRAFTLDESGLEAGLRAAPKTGLHSAAPSGSVTLTLPSPSGGFQRFEVYEAPIMEPALAAAHPDIKTYAGRGIDDPTATIRADRSDALGFHASVRSEGGSWYVDPYYHLDDSVYVSYFGRDLSSKEPFVERGPDGDPDPFDLGFGKTKSAAAGPSVLLRTYRLALVTDPTYSTYFGGPANVTAAKVTLMNRVDQIYEDETAIRLVLIADTDKTNLNTAALATDPNGPCGAAACYTTAQIASCTSGLLQRNRIVLGQIIGAANYDVGHIMLGRAGGGVASLGVIGGNSKAQGCTGLPTPVGDYMAVDYVAHEMGHQFNGNHTFNGTQSNCSGGNRNAGTSVEPGSGSSIMAYAGICQQDNLQPHSDPYWSQRSYDEITSLVTGTRPAVNEVQNISLRDFDGSDSLTLTFNGKTVGPFVRGVNYSAADIQAALSGGKVQTVRLTGYDVNGDSYTLTYKGANSIPIVRGQNNTAAGILAAIVGGSESQQVTLGSFTATQSFQLVVNGTTTAVFGAGGTAISNANLQTAITAITGAGTATVSGAGTTGFTVTFGGTLANTDVPAISVVNCTGACTSAVRENVKGTTGIAGWPAGATVTVGPVTDAGYNLSFGGTMAGVDVDPFTVTNGVGAAGTVDDSTKFTAGILPAGGIATVAGFGGGTFDDTGFQVSFAGTLAGLDQPALGLAVTGGTGFVGETAHGGPAGNNGFLIVDTGNHAPDVVTPAAYTIPPRTPFALTGSATDPDGDPVTYMWEQNDRGGLPNGGSTAGTGLVQQPKTNGPLFRQFGKGVDVSATDTLLYHSPGENAVNSNPTRVFPDMEQILANNTNAATGSCPTPPAAPTAVPVVTRECFSEFLPTSDWVGFLGDRTMNFRLTARDSKPGGGAIGFNSTKVTVANLASPFRVTSQAVSEVRYGTLPLTVTWDVASTDITPINVANVKISLISDQGETVIANSVPNTGSYTGVWPNVAGTHARIKVAAVGNIFFDVSDADITSVVAPTLPVGGTVSATLALSLGTPAAFGAFQPGVMKDYDATSSANVISTAGDATLTVADPSSTAPGHLVNGTFVMPSVLQARAGTTDAFKPVGTAPATLKTYSTPVSNDAVTLGFRQHVDSSDALRTGAYTKTLTFTLSTTTP
ncbi:M12 family metallo-peptidase [Solirubrobacter ginsenosidimutans]|uniref:M12 family metallo-peptidase n=1 Tax=Solirubrobacter ginsenosidimutans TaxID=490573 RepID=A0A9X3S3I8_9ACTN|nr:M12 family metallo-peptidase [Solirubrobacter ginsenosidimutans]MDA0162151.1 M12 family metallo-peptidase [Solirubrobacter ginsenosidimutans]